MSWMLRKGQRAWEIWQDQEKYDERLLSFLKNYKKIPSHFISLEELEMWLSDVEKKIAKSTAIRILASRNYPSQIFKRKLIERGFFEKTAEELAAWAIREGYVQDLEYLRSAIRSEIMKGHGPKLIFWKLRSKEFSIVAINRELKQIMPIDVQIECAQKQLSKLRLGSDFSSRQKTTATLLRRGFSMDVIESIIKTNLPDF